MATATVTVNLEGYDKLIAKLKKLADAHGSVKAGVLEGADNGEGKNVLEYAPIQEFGGSITVTDKMRGFLAANYGIHLKKSTATIDIPPRSLTIDIPPRSFLRTTFAEMKDEWVKLLASSLKSGMSIEDALENVGADMEQEIVQRIANGIPPENSDATNLIKQQEKPGMVGHTLQYTGSLVKAIKHRVEA